MLTTEQRAIRSTGLGASELPSVAGVSPHASPIDVWLAKTSPPALVEDDTGPREVGSILEPSLAVLYGRRTGRTDLVRPCVTLRHPSIAWMLASPDVVLGPVDRPEGLAEFKVVGFRMASDWDDGVPDYVRVQVEQQMSVTGLPWCDVGALIGTDFRIWRCERDPGLAEMLRAIGEEFWTEYVLAKVPPPAAHAERKRDYLSKRFRTSSGGELLDATMLPNAEAIAALARAVRITRDAAVAADAAKEAAANALMEIIADGAGFVGPWGKATWTAPKVGVPSYKAIAEELAGGVLPESLIAKHRSAPARRFNFYPAKENKS